MAEIIALFGPQQAGKSTAARSLAHSRPFVHISFADPLYRALAAVMGISLAEIRTLDKNAPQEALEGKTIRYALQKLGTEWGRDMIGVNLWVNACLRTAEDNLRHGLNVVIDDCRFFNEYEALRARGARLVRIDRPDCPDTVGSDHGSEQDWHSFEADCSVLNNGDAVAWENNAASLILAALGLQEPERSEATTSTP